MTDAQKAERILSEVQLKFVQDEFGHDPDALSVLGDDDFSELYDKLCDIEVAETMDADDGELSERGKMAEGIVTVLGNGLYAQESE